MPFRGLTPSQREAAIRTMLRGRRLAFEIGLDEDWFESTSLTFKSTDGEWRYSERLLHEYPAHLVVLLAAAGSLFYRKVPSLWAQVGVAGNGTTPVGRAFLHALRELRLETFEALVEAETARTYIAPILAHGGVPAYCLPDFFRLLDKSVGASIEAAELIELWKARPSLTASIDRPVARFLTYGGVPARDFLQRAIDLHLEADAALRSPSAGEAGLPETLVDAYWTWREGTDKPTGQGTKISRPAVRLDPWDALGPTLDLPTTTGQATWKVRDQRSTSIYQGSRTFGHTIRLAPAARWEVDLTQGAPEPRTFVFEGLHHHGAIFFEPGNSKLWRDADQLRLDSVWMLHDKELEVFVVDHDGSHHLPTIVEELPQPTGSWGGCSLAHIDLRGVRALLLKQFSTVKSQIGVAPQTSRPSLVGAALDNTRTVAGAPVFSAAPSIALPALADVDATRWQVSVRCGSEVRHGQATTLPMRSNGTLGLEGLLHGWDCQDIELAVRGPLGADLRTNLSVVPGLTLVAPGRVLGPSETGAFRVTVGDNVSVGRHGAVNEVVVQARESATTLEVPVRCGPIENLLRIKVPRLRWSLASAENAVVTMDVRALNVHSSQLTDESRFAVLLLDTGAADVRLRLRLASGPDTLQQSEWVRTSRSGRYAFPLAAFTGTIQQGSHSAFQFIVDAQSVSVPVIHMRSELVTSGLAAALSNSGVSVRVTIQFNDDGPSRPREVRFWSADRPWSEPEITLVPEGCQGAIRFDAPLPLLPGRYLMEVSFPDPWNPPRRPVPGRAKNTVSVALGTPEDREERRRDLDSTDPLQALELATSAGRPLPPMTWENARAIATRALHSIALQVLASGPRAVQSRAVASLVQCVAATPARLAWGVARLLEEERLAQADLLLLAVAVLAAREDVPAYDEGIAVTDSMLRDLWSVCPPLAALYDVPRARAGQEDSRERCEAALGHIAPAPFPTGPTVGMSEWGLTLEQLRAIQPLMELRAGSLLDSDAGIDAAFEWLVAERDGRLQSFRWCQAHPLDEGALQLCDACQDAVESHRTGRIPAHISDRGQKLAQRILDCALHLVQGTSETGRAVDALFEVGDVVPKMIARDLTVAIYLLSGCPVNSPTPEVSEADAKPA